MCLSQGPQRSDASEARTRGPSVLSQALYNCAPFLTLGWGLGLRGTQGVKKKFSNMVMWHIKLTGIISRTDNTSKIFTLWSNWCPWGEVKRSNIIKF